MYQPEISVVIPLYNEADSLPELAAWIDKVLVEANLPYEIIFIDDGSTDNSWNIIEKLAVNNPKITGIKFRRNYGKSPALHVGFRKASGNVVVTMDSDLQDSPEEIPDMYRMIANGDFDLVSGWKKKRYDNVVTKNIPSRFFNWTARKFSGIKIHDFNCGLKAYRKDVIKAIEIYGEMHRYIPFIVKQAGFTAIGEKVVTHRKRKYGTSKFGYSRFIKGYLDLITISFISIFGKRPMHIFGSLGTVMFLIGFGMALYLGIDKLIAVANHVSARLVTSSPYFYIALAAMIIGTQLFLAGFIGELVSRSSPDRNVYLIEKEL